MLMIAEERHRAGDWMFLGGMRAAREALAPWRGLVTIIATVEDATWAAVPPIAIVLADAHDGRPLTPRDERVTPQWSIGSPDVPSVLTGAVAEAVYVAAIVGQTRRLVQVIVNGRGAVRIPVDFAVID